MIRFQDLLLRQKAKTTSNKIVNFRLLFAYVLSTMMSVFFILGSGCSGDDKKPSVSYGSHETAIAESIYSHFYVDKPEITDDQIAELIAEQVRSIIVNGEYPANFNDGTNEHKSSIEAIVELLYNDTWAGTDEDAMALATEVIQVLKDLQSTHQSVPFVMDISTQNADDSFTFKTYTSGADEVYYRMHYRLDCGNGDEIVESIHLSTNPPSVDVEHSCIYSEVGHYQISITQQRWALPIGLPQLRITGGKSLFKGVSQWGSGHWLSMRSMFQDVDTDFTFPFHPPLTRQLQNMKDMFKDTNNFNQTLSAWNVGKVNNMSGLFSNTQKFNADIRYWDVSSVTDMKAMFYNADAFNIDISRWDVSSVTDMASMFYNADAFNIDISRWDVSSVTTMEDMFREMNNFNQPLNNWDVSSVTTMLRMFYGVSIFNQSLKGWNVRNVTTMESMFEHSRAFDQSLNEWQPILHDSLNRNSMFRNVTPNDADTKARVCSWCGW